MDLRPGTIVAAKYRCEREIGRGAMGVVVVATHVVIGQRVALKILRDASSDVAARFAREGRLAGRLKGEHVARVIDAGNLDTGEPFIAMEFLDGEDLATLVRERGPLPVQDACSYIVQACEGLAEAHALGMVHRDVKPANLFIARGPGGVPVIKVLDFGITKAPAMTPDSIDMTNAGAFLGTPRYMSPEQLMSPADVDARSDIWSIGVVLYALLTADTPFAGTTLAQVFRAVLEAPMKPLDRRDVPAELVAIIGRCLRKKSSERYSNLAELVAALSPFAGPDGDGAVSRVAAYLGVSVPVAKAHHRNRIAVAATIALSIAAGAAIVVQPWRPRAARSKSPRALPSASVTEVALETPLVGAAQAPPEESESASSADDASSDVPHAHASASVRVRAAAMTPMSSATANPDGIKAADRKFRAALRSPECVAAWDELRATPGYVSSEESERLHASCLMTNGRCDEGRAVLRDALTRPDARLKRSASELATEVSFRAAIACPDGQLNDEELAYKKRMAIGPAVESRDVTTAMKYADELVRLLPRLPRGGYHNESGYTSTLDAMCLAYSAGARCDAAKTYCAQSCAANGGRVDVCVPSRLGSRCSYP